MATYSKVGIRLTDKYKRLAWLRDSRESFGALDPTLGYRTTVFLGLYEGGSYLRSRLEDIRRQDTQSFYVLIVDNCSSDFDRNKYEEEIRRADLAPGRWQLVRNPANLGGLGSFQLNLDFVPSDWVTSMHQDDYYKSNHVSLHLEVLSKADSSVLTISSDMGSLNGLGKQVGAPPRTSWFLPNKGERHDLFLATVATQAIPFPALSMKKSFAELDLVPWPSVAFSDSELSLRSLMLGRHEFIAAETMLYRENPASESHIQGIEIRNHSAMLGLIRVFGSSNFRNFAADLVPERRAAFANRLQHGIHSRISDSESAKVVEALAIEQLCHAWGYVVSEVNQTLSSIFISHHQRYSANLLQDINKLNQEGVQDILRPRLMAENHEQTYRGPSQSTPQAAHKVSLQRRVIFFCMSVVGLIPYRPRRQIYILVMWVYRILRPGNKWDFTW